MKKNKAVRPAAMLLAISTAVSAVLLTSCFRRSDEPPVDAGGGTAANAVTETVPSTEAETDVMNETAAAETEAQTEDAATDSALSPGEYESGGYVIDNYAAGSVYLTVDGEDKLIYEMTRPAETEAPNEPAESPAEMPSQASSSDDFVPVVPQAPSSGAHAPTVLMYHLILEEPTTSLTGLFVRPSEFDSHMAMLKSEGYEFLFADEYTYTSGKSVMVTVDDGYEDNYTEMFPILKKYGVKATIFVIAGKIGWDGYLTADQIKEMSDSGLVSIQSHTVWHQSLTSMSESNIRQELSDSISILEGITGRSVRALSYPAGSYNSYVMNIAKDYYDYAYTTVSSGTTAGYGTLELPRVRVYRGMSAAGLKSQLKG
jgi:peptidoglycan/xylan/chitin deacetylase (PgdA/CDA1 family)